MMCGLITHCLTTLAEVTEDPSVDLSIHTGQLTVACNSASGYIMASSNTCAHSAHAPYRHICAHTHN